MTKTWVCDSETYPNLHLWVFINKVSKVVRVFQISPIQDDRHLLIKFLKTEVELLVGFNIMQYDYPLLHFFITKLYPRNLKGSELCKWIKAFSDELINQEQSYKNIIRQPLRKYRDLFKIRHYDNRAKQTSLKLLAFNLRMINIQELPYDPNQVLTNEEIRKVIEYCHNDVYVTDALDYATQEQVNLREELGKFYKIDMTNFSNAKIGQELFVKFIQQKLGIERIGKTPRLSINLGNIVFDYVTFNSREFTSLLAWVKGKTITDTLGTFNQISFEDLTSLEGMYNKKVKKECQEGLNIFYKGFQYDFGVGGIHGSIKAGTYQSDSIYAIIDIDVSSFYPKLGIENKLYPAHLGLPFCDIYEEVYITRQGFPKKSAPNLGLKEALNIVYGKSNSPYSPFYDPQYTMSITINGQLLLCMLAESIVDNIEDLTLLQINTDGLTVKIRKDLIPRLNELTSQWETKTRLTLERAEYDKMVIRDVNNYSARFTNGTIKRKGAAFMYKIADYELELHKNHSMLVVPKAIEKYFYEGIQPEDYIPTHEDTYDFFKRVKLPKKFKLWMSNMVTEEIIKVSKRGKESRKIVLHHEYQYQLQNITRYYVAKQGNTIVKKMPPKLGGTEERTTIIEVGYICQDCNDLRNIDLNELRKNINYQYYIDKVRKIINVIENNGELNNDLNEDEDL